MIPTRFDIDMLPAGHGDCLWLEYTTEEGVERVLIDGGTVSTYSHLRERIDALPAADRTFELVVLTHVDADHIEGLIRLFADQPLDFRVRHAWFNGWRQMESTHMLGALQGEFLSALLVQRVTPDAWDADAPAWKIPDSGSLPVFTLAGGMRLTLLSPDTNKLDRMAQEWRKSLKAFAPGDLEEAWAALATKKKYLPEQGLLGSSPDLDTLLESQFSPDRAEANGSSIAFLAEFAGKSALFLADAHPDLICASLEKLCAERGVKQLEVDAVKVSHHGSQNNTDERLLSLIDSPRYLISTNGSHFRHPDAECIARILAYGKPRALYFNYDSKYTRPWLSKEAQTRYGYVAYLREADASALRVEL